MTSIGPFPQSGPRATIAPPLSTTIVRLTASLSHRDIEAANTILSG
jgi:hypothetical protein